MAFIPGTVLSLWGLARVVFLVAARGKFGGTTSHRRIAGGVLTGVGWVLLGVVVLAAAADASRAVLLVVAGAAVAVVVAGVVVAGPEQWARLGDPAAWRGSKR